MNETDFRHRLFELAEDAPSGSSAPPALLRRARRRVVLTIASSVAIAVLVVGMGIAGVRALQSAPTPADSPVEDPRARLDALGERWMTSVATITYRTTERDPGEAASPHQCLRQIAGGEVDRQTALRICAGVGELRLAWDPPDRWRMDAASPDGIFALLSTPEGRLRCRGSDMVAKTCVATESSGPFGSLVDPPALTLDEIGAPVTVEAGRTIAGIRSECFGVEGGPADAIHRAEWCYSGDGLLLFVLDQVEGGRVTIEEATEVSPGVSDRDFIVPST
jgi:hypothetical protein